MLHTQVLLLFRHHYNSLIHQAVALHARRARWHLGLLIHPEDKPVAGLSAVQGLIVADSFGETTMDSLLESGVPLVNLSCNPADFGGSAVIGDHAVIGQIAAEHLIERHHRHFAYYGDSSFIASRLRHAAFAETLTHHGHICLEIECGSPHGATSFDWAAELNQLHARIGELPSPLAVFCFNDNLAGRLLNAALQRWKRVPEDISILGVDDNPLICENAPVPLSSVRHPIGEIAARAAVVLGSLMGRRALSATRIKIPPSGITVRRSTASIAVAHPVLQTILLHLEHNHHHQLQLEDVAAAVGTTPNAVHQLLHAHLDSTLPEEILKCQLAHARRLLGRSRTSMNKIAKAVGFSSGPSFQRAFKNQHGETPNDYRRKRLTAYQLQE